MCTQYWRENEKGYLVHLIAMNRLKGDLMLKLFNSKYKKEILHSKFS